MNAALDSAVSIAFHGLAFAMVLYLVSVGLSITMGLMGFVNLAHGAFAAIGGYIAITLRGSKRETGIWDVAKKSWHTTGQGCQINWMPNQSAIYWVNPTGNGGSQIFHMPITDGTPPSELDDDQLAFMDLPGRRSHEYFPQLSAD